MLSSVSLNKIKSNYQPSSQTLASVTDCLLSMGPVQLSISIPACYVILTDSYTLSEYLLAKLVGEAVSL